MPGSLLERRIGFLVGTRPNGLAGGAKGDRFNLFLKVFNMILIYFAY
jgi:hypothetical protein